MEEYYQLEAVNLEYFDSCLATLAGAYSEIKPTTEFNIQNELYRHALVSSFDRLVVLAYRLLKKRITPYFATKQSLDMLTYKDVFRTAFKHSLITEEAVNNWFKYRENRFSSTANYGQNFIDETLVLVESFILDARSLKIILENGDTVNE